ncbi:MAG: Ribonuclease H [Parcubacteria group bacterium Gr01-1014_73]|nr:MAG: Ribonuclease H [Parcubacteria group bacterium Gr01-1014_73]
MDTDKIIIFTDGSSKGNPGSGGWAAVIKTKSSKLKAKNEKIFEIGGREEHTTNNRMELTAAIEALKALSAPIFNFQFSIFKIKIYSDSKYLIDGINKWIHGWRINGWRTKDKKEVLNRDLWEKLDEISAGKNIDWHYVSGHSGVADNERCDEIAQAFADGKIPKLSSSNV